MEAREPSPYGHHDYREFLSAWLAARSISLRSLARKAGLATGYLPMVLSGKRPLTRQALAKILPWLELGKDEAAFLEALLTLGESDSHEERAEALRRMRRHPEYARRNPRDSDAYEYLRQWTTVAIRELAGAPGFRADARWIRRRLRFKAPLAEIQASLDFLFRAGFLRRLEDGSVARPEGRLECSGGIYRIALGEFHRQTLDLAARSIDDVPRAERQLIGHTFRLDENGYRKAVDVLQRALDEIRSLAPQSGDESEVHHLELALFPLTQKKPGGKDDEK